jgi:Zn-dependent M28 family amino/carboxypeptidase
MLELARGVSQWAHGLKKGVIFLFNTGEEEGLNGAHSFITQVLNYLLMHPLVVFLSAFQLIEKHESCYLL